MARKEKTQEERLKEMLELYRQLQTLGIEKQFEEVEEFYTAANEFIRNKQSAYGKIRLPMMQRELHYELILHHPKPSHILLKYVG